MIKVGIIGGAGYTGGEMLRILLRHPDVEISFVHSTSNAGNPIVDVHQDLLGETELQFTGELNNPVDNVDVLFLCLGHGDARKFLEANPVADSVKIIDLSQDFRLSPLATIGGKEFVYGLPELNKAAIQKAKNIANPGCFATALQLGLLPLAAAGLLDEVYTTGITGSTGAGQKLAATSHFSYRDNNISAYKTLEHQHLKEIYQSLHQLQDSFPSQPAFVTKEEDEKISFVPWRGDFPRGIYISSTVTLRKSLEEIQTIYKDFYKDAAMTFVSDKPIFLKQVVNTSKCLIYLEKVGSKLVIHSIIDNLLKGASGQAVQNMNLLFGLEETAGLKLKGSFF
ncbi:MAG: N-acetyl-gamma-glutamyl-phosphate reductase [Pseudopedobacter saltans]|uniref:N-acetyl-gamma-glutamyl-phosphate reductase n=1 Tax=Pseudopedobacter saltans TaxID=151895 RepID=A0A2W5F515_9SPHI|nr:MAG: N-acetyl-gamma-glutamyl-phosphate reductase [Pseudopedobacter saltans]